MFTPKYPTPDTYIPVQPIAPDHSTALTPATPATAPVPVAASHPTVQLTPGSAVALAAGGGAVVLVVGAVLVSLLLAVAITGVSVAVVAVVLRLLIRDVQKGR
ncbi:SpdD protein [Streptomyces sp. NPDC004327]|uniref:SpdD protein n=1 Tax=Streptomyces sp. NPDC004327 TaxID=3364699 RepID=UPI0036881F9A